jgi:hypothetical protein
MTRFQTRVSNIFAGMRRRTEQKLFKTGPNTGRIRKHGIELPFKAKQLEEWLLARRGDPDKPYQCHWCSRWITLMQAEVDHKVPTGKGGSAGFENLDDICEECNSLKGQMLPESFAMLLAFLRDLGIKYPNCAADVHNRLVKAVAAIKEAGRMRAKLHAQEPARYAAREPVEVEEDF